MITVRLMGGLGNQMFQYAFAKKLALQNHTQVVLDTGFLLDRKPKKNFVYRELDLQIFDMKCIVKNSVLYENKLLSKIQLLSYKLQNKLIVETEFKFNPEFLQKPNDTYIYYGYFQSYKYFEDISDLIRADFTFAKPIMPQSQSILVEILNSESVCLNVRRTDFVTHRTLYNPNLLCETDYYLRAMNLIHSKVRNPKLFVFSDDINWCKANLKLPYPTTFVQHEHKGEKFGNYLQLMSKCKYFIIPNSSFAWWGAWLSGSKTIIAPETWLMTGKWHNVNDVYPEDWVKIPNKVI